jgi:hypothetical protein
LKRNPVICLLVTGLLIFSLTGQAAAAFRMACEGTAACCCKRTAAMAGTAAAMTSMGEGCCATPQPQPCDLAGPGSSPAAPFLPSEISGSPDIAPALAGFAATSRHALDGGACRGVPIRPPSLADLPIYLQIQTFLC